MKVSAAPPAFQPLYRQIKLLITEGLSAGEWRAGDVIPSEAELAARFGVSPGTVRKAVTELASENLLVRHQGKGTFVASHAEEHRRYHFTRVAPDRGEREFPVPQLLELKRARADGATARSLEVAPGSALIVVRRVLRIGIRPVELEEVRVPAALFKGLNPDMIAGQGSLLYGTYEKWFGIRIVRAAERIKASVADAQAAAILGVNPGTPLLAVERVAYTYGERPVEVRHMLYDTREHHYRVNLL